MLYSEVKLHFDMRKPNPGGRAKQKVPGYDFGVSGEGARSRQDGTCRTGRWATAKHSVYLTLKTRMCFHRLLLDIE